jgi:hypothetical protein
MEELISLQDAAKLLNLHPETLRRWDRLGRLDAVKVGSRGDRRYRKIDIEKLVAENKPQQPLVSASDPKSVYVSPKAKLHENFEKAEQDRDKYGYLYLGDDVIEALNDNVIRTRAFVLAEAGYGKSRLLEEAANRLKDQGGKAIVIELKLFAQSGFASLIDYIENKDPQLKTDVEKTPLNVLICLDGLDEVKAAVFDITVDRMRDFIKQHPQLSILISSRWHFYKKRASDFNMLDFSVISLMPFDGEHISKFLEVNNISEKDKEKIFDTLSSSGRELIIKTPRYLELLVEYIKEHGFDKASDLNRAELFDYFIYHKLNLEDKRLNAQRRAMFKSILERLALVMEINQSNVITKEEFITFLEEIDSASTKALMNEDLLGIFYEKSLLVDNDKTLEFENTEFQEYLASKHLLTLRQPFHNLYDLVVEEKLREIHPSWFSTLSYLVEMEPKYLEPLLAFGKTNHQGLVEDEQYHMLLTKFNLDKLSSENKEEVFDHVFNYYQKVLNWISYGVSKNLAYYYTPQQNKKLKSYVEKNNHSSETERNVLVGNVALTVGSVMKLGYFSVEEKNYWKEELLKMISYTGGNGVLQRHALYALEQFNEDSLIDKVIFLQNHKEKLVREQLIDFCIATNPNHPTSIALFIKTLRETFLVGGYEGLQKLNSKKSILTMIEILLKDEQVLKVFLDRDKGIFTGHKSDKILVNIESLWDAEIGSNFERLVISSFGRDTWHIAERSYFISEAVLLIDRKNPGFIFRLISACKNSQDLSKNLFSLQDVFSLLLKSEEVDAFIKAMSEFEHGKRIALWSLQKVKYSKRSDGDEVYEKGRKHFKKEYEEIEKQDQSSPIPPSRDKKIYEEFKFKLEPEKGKYMQDVFDHFNHNEEIIKKFWVEEDKNRLIELVTGSIFDKFDPRGQKITITKIHDGSKTYTMHSWIHIFGECIEVAIKLKMNVTKYRRKIAGYIPFAAYENLLSEILTLLGNLSDEEIDDVLNAYKDKQNDLSKFSPRSLIEIAKAQKIQSSLDILKSFVGNNDFSIYERADAIESIAFLGESKEYFKKVFKQYETTNKDLSEMANKILITNFKDPDAIKWRFKQIALRAKPFVEQEGVHSVGEFESELHSKSFAAPLLELDNPIHIDDFLSLLKKSFQLLEKDQEYFNYVKYIWEIVYAYFDGRKIEGSYQPLEVLENFVSENGNTEGANWFIARLKELRKAYLLHIGKPVSFADSIGIYNGVKQRSYLSIATNEDLYQKVKQIVTTHIQDYLQSEGESLVKKDESDIQKQLQTEIQNYFLKKKLEANVLRESQAKDNTRCDYLILYGWLGPILIELKLASHDDLKGNNMRSKKSYKRLKQYLVNYSAYKSLLVVIDNVRRTSKTKSSAKHHEEVKLAYSDMKNTEVVWLKLG